MHADLTRKPQVTASNAVEPLMATVLFCGTHLPGDSATRQISARTNQAYKAILFLAANAGRKKAGCKSTLQPARGKQIRTSGSRRAGCRTV